MCIRDSFITTQTAAVAGPFEEGTAAGQAANPVVRSTLNASSASSAVPGYTTTPPETTYYSQPNLSGAANARLTSCATSTNAVSYTHLDVYKRQVVHCPRQGGRRTRGG